MWRRQGARESVVPLEPGTCLMIPLGAPFQFRALDPGELTAVAVTMPPWPGPDEAIPVPGAWPSTERPARPVPHRSATGKRRYPAIGLRGSWAIWIFAWQLG